MAKTRPTTAVEQITRSILILRGHRVLLDAELAALYGVTTKRLNETGEAQHRALSGGFHVPDDRGGNL